MKVDQVAVYAESDEDARRIKAQFGLTNAEWIKDTVTARSISPEFGEAQNVAELQFNYTLGIELEILRYIDGPYWHQFNPLRNRNGVFISHVGLHLDDGEVFPEMEHCKLVQETFTIKHTTDYLTKEGSPGFNRKYHYRVFELSPGSYIKYIRRIHPK